MLPVKKRIIRRFLQEAGWNLNNPDATEYEVEGMPNNAGKGYVDYGPLGG